MLAKKMRAREKGFGLEWHSQGHHPEKEFEELEAGMSGLNDALNNLFLKEPSAIESLSQEILAQGPWRFGELPASSLVRKTPESLLNRTNRLKLWRAAREILTQDLEDEATLEAMSDVMTRELTPSIRTSIKAQGYTPDQVIDDVINFDVHKTREEIAG